MMARFRPAGEFSRNVITLMMGTSVAQAIPIAISPILTRLYGPEDFGVLAIFISITNILGAVAGARYELALMLPDSDDDALNIAAFGLLVAAVLSVLLLIFSIFLNESITGLLGNKAIGPWLYLVPPAVFFSALFNILKYYNTRLKKYDDLARTAVFKGLILASVQLAAGFLKAGAGGLVSGQVLSVLFANAKLLRNTLGQENWRTTIRRKRMITLAYRYRDFPKFSMPAALASTLAQNLTNILISSFFSITTLGYYMLVQRVLGMPATLLGSAIGQVFFQRAANEKRKTGGAAYSFDSTVKFLVFISVPTFLILFLVVKDIFAFVFGEEWRVAGNFAQLLVPLFGLRFVVASVTTINSVFEKQKLSLAWQMLLMTSSIVTIVVAHIFRLDFLTFLAAFSAVGVGCYLLLLYLLFLVSRGRL